MKRLKEYIVTGGSGYLGYVVVRELIARGYSPIKIIVLPDENLDKFKDLEIEIVKGNILDRDFVLNQITPGAVVFHIAGIIDIGSVKNDMIYVVNVNGCRNVVDACIANKAERLIYTSSVHIIDPLEGDKIMTEPIVFESNPLVGDYAKSKAMATKYIMEKTKTGELNAVVLYPSGIIGPYDYNVSNFGQVILDYINRKLTAYIRGGYNFVDVRDVADGVIKGYEKGKSGEGYILSGEWISLKQIFIILNEKLNRRKLPTKLAYWFVRMMIPFAELHYRIRRKKPIFSAYSLYTLNVNSNFDNSKSKEELGFNPRPIKESLFDMVDWMFENKKELIKPKHQLQSRIPKSNTMN